MRVLIRHRERTTGLLRQMRQVEVLVSVHFSEVERAIIRRRGLGDFVVLRRQPDSRRAKRLAWLGRERSNQTCDLLVSDLMRRHPNRFVCDTPVHAKAYEQALGDALKMLKCFITDNATVGRAAAFDL